MKEGIRVYNLYPKLVGEMPKWHEHIKRASEMEFDWLYINPINASGFSGSDYAVKDYYLYNPMFVKGWPLGGDDYQEEVLKKDRKLGDTYFEEVCKVANDNNMLVMMDLVINHTAIDSPLTKEKPEWYMKDKDGKILNPGADDNGTWVTWGDLAQIDNLNSSDRAGLWKYWLDMIMYYCKLGVRGFRCDAAYHVPEVLWQYLIPKVKEVYPEAIFLGETLGCTPAELQVVARGGFDIVMNSFKWWDYKEKWFLKDYKEWAGLYPSMTFPENHDTERYAEEVEGNREKAISTYALQSYFCSSIAITLGFEYGFERKIDVVQTNPSWFEAGKYNISNEIKSINKLKKEYKILHEDNMIIPYNFYNDNLFGFAKESLDGKEKIFVIANLSETDWQHAYVGDIWNIMGSSKIKDLSLGHRMDNIPQNLEYGLKPLEVKIFYVKR